MKENEKIEFKREFVSDLNKEVIAFANTNGGEIYIGLNDDGSVFGVQDIVSLEMQVSQHISNTIKPDVNPFVKYERVKIDDKDILKIVINRGSMCPYYISSKGIRPEGVYVRVSSASIPATETSILKMIKETTGESYELTRSLNQNLTFIQAETEFFNAGLSFGENQKRTLGIIGQDGCYTNLGLLLSDQCEHSIKFAIYNGTTKEVFKDRHDLSGSLFRQFEDLFKIIGNYNHVSSPKLNGVKRIDIKDYPDEAIREALLNAIVHRDYGLDGYTLVSMFDDRMEILSLGGLLRGVEMEDVLMGISYLRNKHLADIFYRLHLIEAYGTGISKIKESYKNSVVKPTFEVSSNAFKVVLPKLQFQTETKQKYNSSVDERKQAILEMLKNHGFVTRKDVESQFGISQASAIRVLNEMLEEGLIKKNNSAKNTKYTL